VCSWAIVLLSVISSSILPPTNTSFNRPLCYSSNSFSLCTLRAPRLPAIDRLEARTLLLKTLLLLLKTTALALLPRTAIYISFYRQKEDTTTRKLNRSPEGSILHHQLFCIHLSIFCRTESHDLTCHRTVNPGSFDHAANTIKTIFASIVLGQLSSSFQPATFSNI
jgi:hypothetical protein